MLAPVAAGSKRFPGPITQFGRGSVVFGAVGDLVADDPLSLGCVAFSRRNGSEVEPRDFFVGSSERGGLGGFAGGGEVALGEFMGGHRVGDIDDGDGSLLVQAVAVNEPSPACVSIGGVVEGATFDQ